MRRLTTAIAWAAVALLPVAAAVPALADTTDRAAAGLLVAAVAPIDSSGDPEGAFAAIDTTTTTTSTSETVTTTSTSETITTTSTSEPPTSTVTSAPDSTESSDTESSGTESSDTESSDTETSDTPASITPTTPTTPTSTPTTPTTPPSAPPSSPTATTQQSWMDIPGYDGVPRIPQGGSFRVQGGGFQPGETVQVILHSTPIVLGSFIADPDGSVGGIVTIPGNADPTSHTVELVGDDSGVSLSEEIFVIAADTSQPSSEQPSSTEQPAYTPSSTGSSPQLAFTGLPSGMLGLAGAASIALGGLVLLAGRRRSRPAPAAGRSGPARHR